MKFSTRATYGLIAMLYLANRYGQSTTPVSQIGKDSGISSAYLEQLLNRLKKEGWVRSVRGSQGGYVLTQKPSNISVGDVLSALGEDVNIAKKNELKLKRSPASIAAKLFWERFSNGLSDVLQAYSLQDLMEHGHKKSDVQKTLPINFNI